MLKKNDMVTIAASGGWGSTSVEWKSILGGFISAPTVNLACNDISVDGKNGNDVVNNVNVPGSHDL